MSLNEQPTSIPEQNQQEPSLLDELLNQCLASPRAAPVPLPTAAKTTEEISKASDVSDSILSLTLLEVQNDFSSSSNFRSNIEASITGVHVRVESKASPQCPSNTLDIRGEALDVDSLEPGEILDEPDQIDIDMNTKDNNIDTTSRSSREIPILLESYNPTEISSSWSASPPSTSPQKNRNLLRRQINFISSTIQPQNRSTDSPVSLSSLLPHSTTHTKMDKSALPVSTADHQLKPSVTSPAATNHPLAPKSSAATKQDSTPTTSIASLRPITTQLVLRNVPTAPKSMTEFQKQAQLAEERREREKERQKQYHSSRATEKRRRVEDEKDVESRKRHNHIHTIARSSTLIPSSNPNRKRIPPSHPSKSRNAFNRSQSQRPKSGARFPQSSQAHHFRRNGGDSYRPEPIPSHNQNHNRHNGLDLDAELNILPRSKFSKKERTGELYCEGSYELRSKICKGKVGGQDSSAMDWDRSHSQSQHYSKIYDDDEVDREAQLDPAKVRAKILVRLARVKREELGVGKRGEHVVGKSKSRGAISKAELVCYNCMQKGHWFMDCKGGCGRCGGVGHRAVDCEG